LDVVVTSASDSKGVRSDVEFPKADSKGVGDGVKAWPEVGFEGEGVSFPYSGGGPGSANEESGV
jgi:hypothetical protein